MDFISKRANILKVVALVGSVSASSLIWYVSSYDDFIKFTLVSSGVTAGFFIGKVQLQKSRRKKAFEARIKESPGSRIKSDQYRHFGKADVVKDSEQLATSSQLNTFKYPVYVENALKELGLDITQPPSKSDIKHAYHKKVRNVHPDRNYEYRTIEKGASEEVSKLSKSKIVLLNYFIQKVEK